ncbi:MAG: GTP cyclohydrolase II [Rhodocyclaceae bacterium]|nr:GTP cyclohydrolase II [Rhodocyclaceae bacterium]
MRTAQVLFSDPAHSPAPPPLPAQARVARRSSARLPTRYGLFTAHAYAGQSGGRELLALCMGDATQHPRPLVRVHSECLTGDVFGSLRCDCRAQLEAALIQIRDERCGVLVYMSGHEGRGIGLVDKLRAYALQDMGCDTVQANVELNLPVDARDYCAAAHILDDLGIARLRLMTNNPDKCEALSQHGLDVERVALVTPPGADNARYLHAKQRYLGHLLGMPAQPDQQD